MMACAPSSRAASATTATAWPPADRIIATVSLTRSSDRAAQTTRAPSRANSCASARPMPLLAPVTMATRFASSTQTSFIRKQSFDVHRANDARRTKNHEPSGSDHALLLKSFDLIGGHAEPFAQDLFRVFSEQRRRRSEGARRVGHLYREAGHATTSSDWWCVMPS